jgi:hypothetical protein
MAEPRQSKGKEAEVDAASPTSATDDRWTVMVFMGAANTPFAAPLQTAARDDLQEMAFSGNHGGKSAAVEVFVQVHGLGNVPQRGRVVPGRVELGDIPSTQRTADEGEDLENFVSWSLIQTPRTTPCWFSGGTPSTSGSDPAC